ncbi:HD domain-containing protein [Paracoccus gahaiensis]|uniref:HD domain-containing protein n=1 Tax=Paracoccus gahaiensis TaxID=1706839 RepID=A0A4U0R4L4_9RHOB|nr:HD domain-containing protein [Paracoccus gahaiensis]TJZ89300.1 HD domain-containing protein [Paracoccus gahaiensis]
MDLERAIEIAASAHRGQRDKADAPFILHPLRVMHACSTASERIVAVLHDVVEDSHWTLEDLRSEGLEEELLAAVDAMTRRESETYADFVNRAARNSIARAVKIADLRDNLDMTRIADPTPSDEQRSQKYLQALRTLGVSPE